MTRDQRPGNPLHDRRRSGAFLVIGVQLLALTLAACTVGAGASASPIASASPATGSPSAPPASSATVTVPAAVLDPLIDDAAARTGTARDSIAVVEGQAETWPNGALGCPTPGMMYTQAIVHGWKVILDAGGTRIDYRVSAPGRFIVC